MRNDYPLWYDSFEDYANLRWLYQYKESSDTVSKGNRDAATAELRRLKSMLNAFDIDPRLFQKPSTKEYLMTEYVTDLFRYILNQYDEPWAKSVRKKDFKAVPESHLVIVRGRMSDALKSVRCPEAQYLAQIDAYDARTGCPKRILLPQISQPIKEYLEWAKKQGYTPPGGKWDMIAEMLEMQYMIEWKPKLFKMISDWIPDENDPSYQLLLEVEARVMAEKKQRQS